jgi:hypothetical protein
MEICGRGRDFISFLEVNGDIKQSLCSNEMRSVAVACDVRKSLKGQKIQADVSYMRRLLTLTFLQFSFPSTAQVAVFVL